ncbi:type VI secretion system-associated FHA domain protein TagH [Roseibium denhamense]|uniref:FHA domain protein n=1 Tax=Roseibium denhamense TaxID=76305 RepID=A0ABY1NRS4_9HYPH|nr:type VI secretion system-associated FHA domain protein TagH [Roseibium denhamense]MTI08029.1 type VI secretion system-associated FHA domain protein TagH [Roseibium denhamense]SMP15633.1 FHA domain protein [Roseibium denhamense]
MRITLQIENKDRLETGGQISYSCVDRGFDIGRHEHLDWSLPDPQRVISGKHCEVRFEGGQYVLYDVSTNGTFLNGNPNRMDQAHALRSGDRLMIGDYIISVGLDESHSPALEPVSSGQPQWAAPAPPLPEPPAAWPEPGAAAAHPYPQPDAGHVWGAAPGAGVEGRHAPPSQTPGIGTPADDVWGQQGPASGTADPGLFDTGHVPQGAAPVRPLFGDSLDHLAQQPDLQRSEGGTPQPEPAPQPVAPVQASPAPPPAASSSTPPQPAEPLFGMPDLGQPEPPQAALPQTAPPPAEAPVVPEPPNPDPGGYPESVNASIREAPVHVPGGHDQAPPVAAPVISPNGPRLQASAASAGPSLQSAPELESGPENAAGDGAVSLSAEPQAGVVPQDAGNDGGKALLKAFAQGAGIPENIVADRDPEEFARELGSILQTMTGDLMGLLQARSQVKALTRNANRTLISRTGNNALKFSPTPQMALQTMLSEQAEANGYLPLERAMTAAFKDIQKHHVWTYSAMQKAAARLQDTLSPAAIEAAAPPQKSTFGNPKAKLWDRIEERWTSISASHDDGLVGVFTQYFTESYEDLSSPGSADEPGQMP